MNVLVTVTIMGNMHSVRDYCNERGLADYLLQADVYGSHVTMLFRMPLAERERLGL